MVTKDISVVNRAELDSVPKGICRLRHIRKRSCQNLLVTHRTRSPSRINGVVSISG